MSIKERKVVQFYYVRQHNVDRLVCRLQNFDWSVVMQCTDIDFAYDKFVETVHCIIDETIPCRKITVTESTPPHITPLVKSLLRKRNALMRKGKIDRGNEISVKIGKLISEFRSSQLSSISQSAETAKITRAQLVSRWPTGT